MKFVYTAYAVKPSSAAPDRTILYRPVIPIRIVGPKASRNIYALLDTGADESYITESMADKLGVEPLSREISTIQSASGELSVVYGHVTVEVADNEESYSMSIPVGIVSEEWSEAILGHSFLEYFEANFSYAEQVVTLTPRRP